MITGLIAVVLLVPVIAGAGNGEWGVVAVSGILIVFLLALGAASRSDSRAWANRTSYWSKSGKDRAKLRHKWEAEARREEVEERARLRAQWKVQHERKVAKEARRKRRVLEAEAEAWGMSVEEYEAQQKAEQARAIAQRIAKTPAGELFTCKYCQKAVRGKRILLPVEDGVIQFYLCPVCGRQAIVVP